MGRGMGRMPLMGPGGGVGCCSGWGTSIQEGDSGERASVGEVDSWRMVRMRCRGLCCCGHGRAQRPHRVSWLMGIELFLIDCCRLMGFLDGEKSKENCGQGSVAKAFEFSLGIKNHHQKKVRDPTHRFALFTTFSHEYGHRKKGSSSTGAPRQKQ
jgi:hypothetical protein